MKKTKKIILASLLLLFSIGMQAQVPPHPGGGGSTPPGGGDLPVGAPLDGGISILIALGAAYGLKRNVKIRKINE